jgi:peptidoglycan/LPS O-acetylase OafA/YrhL
MKRLECLDGLRGVLAVYVMLGHMAPFSALPPWITRPLSHGGAAVDVFFILSGLVIVRSLESFRCQPWPFLIARAARIFPVYLAMFALAVAVQPLPSGFDRMPWIGPESLAHGMWSDGWPRSWPADIATHLTMTHGLWPAGVLPDIWVSFLGAAWSLSTEWQFYLLALLLGRAGLRAPRMAALFLGLALAGLLWRAAMPPIWQFSRAFLPNKAQYFAVGIASCALVSGGPRTRVLYGIVLISALLLSFPQGGFDKLLPPLFWTLCLTAQLRPDLPGTTFLSAALRVRPILWLGAVSYCTYLANEPIQKLLGVVLSRVASGDPWLFTAIWVPGAILLPLAAAAWLHRSIEAPALQWGRALASARTTHLQGAIEHGY